MITIHPTHPQARLIERAANIIQQNGVVVYPTDVGYAIGCQMGAKEAIERIRQICSLSKDYQFTLLCHSLSQIASYAYLDNINFRLLKANISGVYSFILTATKEVPRRLIDSKNKTIGIGMPQHIVILSLLEMLDQPLVRIPIQLKESDFIQIDEIKELLNKKVDLIIDSGFCPVETLTVMDLTERPPKIMST